MRGELGNAAKGNGKFSVIIFLADRLRRPIGSVRTTGRLPGRVFPLIIVYVAYHLGLASGPQFINANNIGVPECKSAPRDRDPELVNDPLSVDRSRSPLIAGIRGRFAGQFVGKNRS